MSSEYIGNSGILKVDPINELQLEVVDILKEECAELIQAASKVKRCGQGFIADDGKDLTAKQRFSVEIADVLTLIAEAADAGLIDTKTVHETLWSKRDRLKVWTHQLGELHTTDVLTRIYELLCGSV